MHFGAGQTGMPSGLSPPLTYPLLKREEKKTEKFACNDPIPS